MGAGEQRSKSSDADAIPAMSFHGKQRSSLGECECLARQYEAQNVDMLRDTKKAAILAHPQDQSGADASDRARRDCRSVMHSKVCGKRNAKASAKAKTRASAKAKRKEKARISGRKEHQTRRTRNAPSVEQTIVPSL